MNSIFLIVCLVWWFLVDKADFLFPFSSTYVKERKRYYMQKTGIDKVYQRNIVFLSISYLLKKIAPLVFPFVTIANWLASAAFMEQVFIWLRCILNWVARWTGRFEDKDLYHLNLLSLLFLGREIGEKRSDHRTSEFQVEADFNKTSGKKRTTSVKDSSKAVCSVVDEGPHFNRVARGCLL